MDFLKESKLIIDFMKLWESEAGYFYFPQFEKAYRLGDFKFHKSWDWLMLVVEKIETLNDGGFDVSILTDGTLIHQYRLTPNAPLSDGIEIIRLTSAEIGFEEKINHVYQAVTQFIEWYNKN